MHALSAVAHLKEHIDTGEPLDLIAAQSSLDHPSLRAWIERNEVLLIVRRDGLTLLEAGMCWGSVQIDGDYAAKKIQQATEAIRTLTAERNKWKDQSHQHAQSLSRLQRDYNALTAENERMKSKIAEFIDGELNPAPWPPCMAPDGAEPCTQYQALTTERDELRERLNALLQRELATRQDRDRLIDEVRNWKEQAQYRG